MKHKHLIPANFDDYNLDDFIKENESNSFGVCWSNGGSGGVNAQAFNIGDEVYIYFHDARRLTDRILLRAEVCKSDCTDDNIENEDEGDFLYSKYCKRLLDNKEALSIISDEKQERIKQDAESNIKGFYLNNFNAISEKYENEFKYIHKNEIIDEKNQKPGIMGIRINQTKVYLDKQKNNKYVLLSDALVEDKFKREINTLRDKYNADSCIICTDSQKGMHSFLKPNNLYYYEIHHILQQNLNNIITKKKLSWFKEDKYIKNNINVLIYNDYNEVKLCPYHHNQLHYGKYEERKKMLDKLIDYNYKKRLKEQVKNNKDYEDILEYIYAQYGVSYKNN